MRFQELLNLPPAHRCFIHRPIAHYITRIDGIYMDKVTCESADAVYELKGNAELPVKNVRIKDVKVGSVKKFVKKVSNVENVVEKNVTYSQKD